MATARVACPDAVTVSQVDTGGMEHAASIHIFFSRRKSVQELFDVVERRGPIWTRLEDFSIVEDYNSLSNPDNDDDHFFNVIYAASYVLCFSTLSFFFRC